MNRYYISVMGLYVLSLLPHTAISQAQAPVKRDVVCRADAPEVTPAPLAMSQDAPAPAPAIPTAPTIRDIERDEKGFPKWSNFPAAPENVPTSADIRQRVNDIKSHEVALEAAVAGLNWETIDPAAYSSTTRARLNTDLSRPVTKNNCGDIHQFALSTRARVVVPPSPDR